MRRLAVAIAVTSVAGLGGPAFAQDLPPLVGVHQSSNGGVCVGVSYQVEQCTPAVSAAK